MACISLYSGNSRNIIEIRGLSFRYHGADRDSLENVNLEIGEREIVVIAGHSGSGKSTLLRCLNGLIPFQHSGTYVGEVLVAGRKVTESRMSELAKSVGFVFQNPENQIFMFSVERDIAFGLENLGFPREEIRRRVDEIMDLLGIKGLALRAPHELSDGQKQRVAIAGVMVMRPEIIVLDEPTSLLDPFAARELLQLILRLRNELGMTILIVEHRLDLLTRLATRLIVMDRGRIMFNGQPEVILSEEGLSNYGVLEPTIVRLAKQSRLRRPDGKIPLNVEDFLEVSKADLFRKNASKPIIPFLDQHSKNPYEPLQEIAEESLGRHEAAVSFEGVDYSRDNGVAALIGISLDIRKGETVAIMGANGAGKSTLIRHINGLLKPTHGKVTTLGVETRMASVASLSRKVGIVFQNPNSQLFAQTVESEIEFALKNFGFPPQAIKERVEWALDSFDLSRYSDSSPMELSGGERKRLCIALVLAWEPEIIILDEPTVGQDSNQKEKLVEIIKMLGSQNKTVIIVSHDVEFIWPLQPRIVLMSHGRIVGDGPAQTVLTDEDLLNRARVVTPQLVELSKAIGLSRPFPRDVKEASVKMTETFEKGTMRTRTR
jgi:energy-coupling factor transporter ATP-binding protein EcfA2